VNIKYIINEFKSQVAFVLLLIWLLSAWHFRTTNVFAYPLFAVILTTFLDLTINKFRGGKFYWPSASLVSGALIGLILAPAGSILPIVVACTVAVFSKQFINTGIRQHIFNPAALGIMVASLTLNVAVAWWAVAWSQLPLIILVPSMIRVLWRMKRLFLPLTFILVYLAYYLTIFPPLAAVKSLVDGSLLLFALVMLPEPMTSPVVGKFKYTFATAVALVSIGLSYSGIFSEVFLPALLAANLGAFLIKKSFPKSPQTKSGQNDPK